MIMKSRVGLVVAGVIAAALPGVSWAAVSVSVGNATVQAGGTTSVDVTVNIDGGDVVGSLDITTAWSDTKVRIPAKANPANADCTANADLEATLAQFKFVPNMCATADCTGVRTAFLGRDGGYNTTAVFYTCKVSAAGDAAAGDYQLTVPDAKYSTPGGVEIVITGTPGTITVQGAPTEPPTATATPVPPTATNTPVPPTRTNTPVAPTATNTLPAPTRTNTALPTHTAPPSTGANDGCQMGSQSNSSGLVLLLLPVAFAAVIRRRAR